MRESISDEELIKRCKSGDDLSLNELIERYKRMGFSMAYTMTGNREDAEDLSQEAFVIVHSNIRKFREESSFKTWFYKIVLNLCRKYHRKKKLLSIISFNLFEREGEEQAPEAMTDATPEKELLSRQTGAAIFSALKRLPARQREVFAMKHVRGLKINEISEVLGCSEGTVKSHLFRAVRRLQKEVGEYK